MGTGWERAYCHWYAKTHYSGTGEVVEAGCWLGGFVLALARGLDESANGRTALRPVHAFDRFEWDRSMNVDVERTHLAGRYRSGDNFRAGFEEQIAPVRPRIVVHEGDLLEATWPGGDIEFLLVDAMKTFGLSNSILRNFFPHLIPGRSVVMHQDFCHWWTSWIHPVMYRLREYFEPVYDIPYSASVVFALRHPLPSSHLIEYGWEDFSTAELDAAFAYSESIVDEQSQAFVTAARVASLAHRGKVEEAWAQFEARLSGKEGQAAQEIGLLRHWLTSLSVPSDPGQPAQ